MKHKVNTLIIGCGAGGLGSACWLKDLGIDFMVVDIAKEIPLNLHNGVHYLHSIPSLPFKSDIKKITLTDAILFNDKLYDRPSLRFALQYSEKTGESQRPSSIMSVGKKDTAYMPASNTLNTLLKEMSDFVKEKTFLFSKELKYINPNAKIAMFKDIHSGIETFIEYQNLISTIPLDVLKKSLASEFIDSLKLECNPIFVANYKVENIVPNWMINIYIPDFKTKIYRASILNGILSVESTEELNEHDLHSIKDFLNMFHISMEGVQSYQWKTGKVVSISTDERSKLIEELKELSVYSIGRFGVWNRKLLVDSTIEQAKLVCNYIANKSSWEEIKEGLIK